MSFIDRNKCLVRERGQYEFENRKWLLVEIIAETKEHL